MLIRNDHRTVRDVLHRIDQGRYVMNPDFQRDFIWPEDKQSKLIESVIMRIPLPVFYMAEDSEGRMVVVDGLQRLSTFKRFSDGDLKLRLPDRLELNGKAFSDLPPKYQNRVEDCNLIFYIIDSKAPERARLDIFERVNGGQQLTRQQMRNCLYMGKATQFLRCEAHTDIFRSATGASLSPKTMRDREFVNRFCAFQVLGPGEYQRDDMDDFLARALRRMNEMSDQGLAELSADFRRSLQNNFLLFGRQAFRKHEPGQQRRTVLNASLWDVMSTGLSHYSPEQVESHTEPLRETLHYLLWDESFNTAISYGPNDPKRVHRRFEMARRGFSGGYSVIARIDLTHFKCFDLLRLPLQRLTLLSGLNASGKSSVLQALVLVHQTIREHEWSKHLLLNGTALRLGAVRDVIDQVSGGRELSLGIEDDVAGLIAWELSGEQSAMSMVVREVRVSGSRNARWHQGESQRYAPPASRSHRQFSRG